MSAKRLTASGAVAALPMAAAVTLALARWLPIQFEYHPNELGIVSVASVQRYPIQQETFWAVFCVVVGSLLAWWIGRALTRTAAADGWVGRVIGMEVLGAAALLAMLWLPPGIGEAACAVACAGGFALARAAGPAALAIEAETQPSRPERSRLSTVLWVAAGLVVAPLLTSGLWIHVWNVFMHVADERVVVDNFKFMGETGQHLAWANALRHGWFQGRDVFCLYGPLYDLGLVGFWELVGRSASAWNLYWALSRIAGWTALFWLGAALVRNRMALLVLPFLLPWVELRVGLALFAALLLQRWLQSQRSAWLVASGSLAGVALLYSQEYGTALGLVAMLAFAIRRDWRAPLWFGGGALFAMAPLVVYYAASGALVPMLSDVIQYPSYMIAGYGKLPFVGAVSNLPLVWSELGSRASETLRLSYAVPLVCVGGLLLALPATSFDLRRPLESLRKISEALARDPQRLMWVLVAVFGLIAFRSAMGRASLHRTHAALPAVALLLCMGLDRGIALWRRSPSLAGWRLAALLGFVALGGFLQTASPLDSVAKSVRLGTKVMRYGHRPQGDPHVMRVTRWVQLNTEPSEPVLFLPNNGAYYYLSDRPNPIRFVMGHQILGDRHRAEVLGDLRTRPPRFIVWDHHALRVDDLPDELVFGPGILGFIDDNYATERHIGEVEILRHRSLKEPALIAEW